MDAINSEIYVDKTGLIAYTNKVCGTAQKYICNSRPRRFGKSYTAEMLTAYYSRGCDSKGIFSGLLIEDSDSFEKNLNQCNVIHLDMQWCMMDAGSPEKTVSYVNAKLVRELKSSYPGIVSEEAKTAFGVLTIAFLASMQYYFRPVRELPSERGFADFVYIPKPEYRNDYPALVVELKWNKRAQTALDQIKEKRYPDSLRGYTGNILLVGISYDRKIKSYQCRIEKENCAKTE